MFSKPTTSPQQNQSALSNPACSEPIDIPPLPKTLMTVEDIGGMQFVTIDCPDVRERQAAILEESICNVADKHDGRVTILMGKVANFSCAWINSLLAINTKCTAKGGTLTLTGVAQPAAHMLKQMGLAKKFRIV
jgi:anti-anti-sigma regulatory factor